MKQRIWELDALRGLCVLGMVAVHAIYDLTVLYRLIDWNVPPIYTFIQTWGGVLFLLISGICVTLGSRPVRRGLLVFCCGMLCTGVTAGMVAFNLAGEGMIIWFGVLHCLGICMILWPVFRKLPAAALVLIGVAMAALGLWLAAAVKVSFPWLVPLGITFPGFVTSDYFPLLPHLGFFLLGAFLGKTLYKNKTSLLPGVNAQNPVLRFLQGCGKHSLWIYLLHQPLLTGVFTIIILLR